LAHPAEAFAYYRHEGVLRIVCEAKRMGSRAGVIVCRDEDATRRRFGVIGEGSGIVYTRSGRRFFAERHLERAFLARAQTAVWQYVVH
jgi:protein phosphatase